MKKYLLLLLCIVCNKLYAQYHNERAKFLKANSVWIFGQGAGLDFNNSFVPQSFASAFNINADSREGCASLADTATGMLQFYFGAYSCFNRDHNLMPSGSNIMGNRGSTTEGACIVPLIDEPGKYYLFSLNGTTDGAIPSGTLFYSVIDMGVDSGKGDIVPGQKNIVLYHNTGTAKLGEAMIAIPGNNCEIWLVVHQAYEPVFFAYRITANGVDPAPVVSAAGTVTDPMAYYLGGMTVSPNRKLIAMCSSKFDYQNAGGVDLCHFDPENGKVSGPVALGPEPPKGAYVAAFSPNSNFLYVSSRDQLLQYNVKSYNANAISGSRIVLGSMPKEVASAYLKLYHGVIYVNTPEAIGSISDPDKAGTECHYQPYSITLAPDTKPLNMLPNEVVFDYRRYDTIPDLYLDTQVCYENNLTFTLKAKPGFSEYIWNDGSTGPGRVIDHEGTYFVYYKGSCNYRVDTFKIAFVQPFPRRNLDTMVCDRRFPFSLGAPITGDGYSWPDGATANYFTVYQPGDYWVHITRDGCTLTDTIHIRSEFCPCGVRVPNAFSPNGDGMNDRFRPVIGGGCIPAGYHCFVYNRWGQRVYESYSEYDEGWDGRGADAGTYFYELRFKSRFLDKEYYKKGEVILVR